MKSILTVVSVILGMVLGCQDTAKMQTGSRVIVDSFPDIPFNITKPKAIVPDSLGGQNLTGKMVLEVRIDSSGSILTHRIVALMVSDGTEKIDIDYRIPESKEHRGKIAIFVNWTEEYIKKLFVTKKSDYDKRYEMEKYTILVPVRFGG